MPKPSFDSEALEPWDWAMVRWALKDRLFDFKRKLMHAQDQQERAHKRMSGDDFVRWSNYIKAAHRSIDRCRKLLELLPEISELEQECNQWE
jgi:hypothetical protein